MTLDQLIQKYQERACVAEPDMRFPTSPTLEALRGLKQYTKQLGRSRDVRDVLETFAQIKAKVNDTLRCDLALRPHVMVIYTECVDEATLLLRGFILTDDSIQGTFS